MREGKGEEKYKFARGERGVKRNTNLREAKGGERGQICVRGKGKRSTNLREGKGEEKYKFARGANTEANT